MDVDAFVKKNPNARGVVVIIGNEEYDDPQYNNLPGAMKDAEAMESTFKYLQFATRFLKNATGIKISNTIHDVAVYGSYPPGYKCFAVVFAGHGGSNNIIVSKDGHKVSIKEAIIEQLDASRHIANIPKIVFIDACRGGKAITQRNEDELAVPNDMFVAYSTKNGYMSYEEPFRGGMWMQILAEELRSSKKSVGDTVVDVNKKVKAKYSKWIQPQIYNTTVDIVLSAGLNDGDNTDEAASSQQTGASFSPPSPSQVPATTRTPSTLSTTPSTFSVDIPSLSTLTLLKWTDKNGEAKTYELVEQVSSKWTDIVTRLELDHKLANYKQKNDDNEMRLKEVFSDWIDQGGHPEYPLSWTGVFQLLRDVRMRNPAEKLQKALENKGLTF